MDEGRMLLALSPIWRRIVVDVILVGSWVACVAICYPLVQLATDHPPLISLLEAVAPGTLLYWIAVWYVLGWCAAADKKAAAKGIEPVDVKKGSIFRPR